MAKLSKKQINKIESISIFSDVIKIHDSGDIAGTHWIDLPPDMWGEKERVKIYDMMNELEMKLKQEILQIVCDEK